MMKSRWKKGVDPKNVVDGSIGSLECVAITRS